MAGIPVLADWLTQIQASIITNCLPGILKNIDEKLDSSSCELNNMTRKLSTVADAMKVLMHILRLVRESLDKVLIKGEYDEFPAEKYFHGAARIFEMVQNYSAQLPTDYPTTEDELFLMEEVNALEESRGIWLPKFLPRSVFNELLKKKINIISHTPNELIHSTWAYIENLTIKILSRYIENSPQIQSTNQMVVHDLISKFSTQSIQFAKKMIEVESCAHYTSNPDYMTRWSDLMTEVDNFMEAIKHQSGRKTEIYLEAFGEVDISHLRSHADVAKQAFDLRMRLTAYWKTIVLRMVDGMALHISHSIKCLVENELEEELIEVLVGSNMAGIKRMLEESPAIAAKREKLQKSVELLRQSKDVVASIMDKISVEVEK